MLGGCSCKQAPAETAAAARRGGRRERSVALVMQGKFALVVLMLTSASGGGPGPRGDASHVALRGLGRSPPGLLGRRWGVISLRGGLEVEEVAGSEVPYTEERDDGVYGELFQSVFPKLQAARSDDERETAFMNAVWESVFDKNRSQPEHYLDAAHKYSMGFPLESAQWSCLRCGKLSPAYSPQCVGCALRRVDVEFATPPEELGRHQPPFFPSSGPPWRQPRGKWIVSLVNSHTNATLKRWHLWEIDLRFALS